MKYVQSVAREEPRLVQPSARPSTLTSTSAVSTSATFSSPSTSATPVPVIRFSNETVTDGEIANGVTKSHQPTAAVNGSVTGSSNSSGNLPILPDEIKNEITTEDNLPSAVNSDLMSKIRNVFSDDSDSDSD